MGKRSLLLLFLVFSLPLAAQTASSYRVNKNFLLGKTDYHKEFGFMKVTADHATKPLFLKEETYLAFIEMYEAAKKEGISLRIISGTRNFHEQKAIWERKWKAFSDLTSEERMQKILEFSSMPGTSRHHWGTDMDLNNLENSYFESGKGKLEYEWLTRNAEKFGFYQVYTSKDAGRTGYAEEKWHWSYLPLADLYLRLYNELVEYSDIADFKGAELAEQINMIPHYVNGISIDSPPKPLLAALPEEESSLIQPQE